MDRIRPPDKPGSLEGPVGSVEPEELAGPEALGGRKAKRSGRARGAPECSVMRRCNYWKSDLRQGKWFSSFEVRQEVTELEITSLIRALTVL